LAEKSIRGNSLPTGGALATTEASQGQPLLPNTQTLVNLSEMFMERSEANCIKLNQVTVNPGQQVTFTVQNVGLGESLEFLVTGAINIKNTAGAPADVSLSPEFPFNIFSNILTQFNGSTVINSLSGYELLGVMAKRGKGVLLGQGASAGTDNTGDQVNARVNRSTAWATAGTDLTITAGNGLLGISKVTVAANKTGVLNFGMYLHLPYTMRNDILLGLIPMQNNSVYANVQLTCPLLLGATAASPLYVTGGVPGTLTVDSTAIQCQPTYNFWAIPMPNDPKLYQYLVSHSYMLLSQPANPISKTGPEALVYNMPNNYYLLTLLLTLRDGNGALQNIASALDNPYLSYNGTARVDRRDIKTRLARQNLFYEGISSPLGQLIWDGTADVTHLSNGANSTKWLNMYLANNPQFIADVVNGLTVPASFSMLREQLVPANVQIV
jgi:hypothetical protein